MSRFENEGCGWKKKIDRCCKYGTIATHYSFVRLIIDYIVVNGNIDDNKVLMGELFKSVGSITTLFKNDLGTAKQIMDVVDQIKKNSEETA